MKFEDLLQDIKKLIGLRLKSIVPGAEFTLTDVDTKYFNLTLVTKNRTQKSRPISELQRIWEQLCVLPAVHVDSVLKGSGSSRNQPETILANLPYIEWLRIGGRKHICWTRKNTHPFGILKQMDEIEAEKLKIRISEAIGDIDETKKIIIITDQLAEVANEIEMLTGLNFKSIEQGVYKLVFSNYSVMVVAKNNIVPNVQTGSYTVIPMDEIPDKSIKINLDREDYFVVPSASFQIMVVKK